MVSLVKTNTVGFKLNYDDTYTMMMNRIIVKERMKVRETYSTIQPAQVQYKIINNNKKRKEIIIN